MLRVMERRGEDNERPKEQAIKSFVPLFLSVFVLFSVFLPTKVQGAHVENRQERKFLEVRL